jgi:hypothetical protein
MPLTALPYVKGVLNIAPADTSQDPWLLFLIDAASEVITSYLGRRLESANYVEFYDGTSQRVLVLGQRPVTAINNLWVDFNAGFGFNPSGAFGPDTLLQPGVDYALDLDSQLPHSTTPCSRSGIVYRLKTYWQEIGRTYFPGKLTAELGPAYGCIKVDYVAGYPAGNVPHDLQYAAAYLVAYMKRTLPVGALLAQEKIGDYAYRLQQVARYPELGSVVQVLSRYKEVAL